ncbi:MAG: AraC family transcriptional regulator [Armatimonadota bacterium]
MSAIITYPCSYADNEAPTFVETYRTTTPEFESDYHLHAEADWEIQYIPHGHAVFSLDDQSCNLDSGELIIINPNQPHICESSLGCRRALTFRSHTLRVMPFHVRRDRVTGGLQIEGRRVPSRLSMPARYRPMLDQITEQLESESTQCEPLARAMCNVLLSQFLLLVARQALKAEAAEQQTVSPDAQRMVEQFCAELRANLDYPWTLDEMVRRSGYSAAQLCRFFDQVMAQSPCRWLREERVRGARELLVQTDKKMAEIAVEVGFETRCQLHRVFRKSTGMSPDHYRNLMRQS